MSPPLDTRPHALYNAVVTHSTSRLLGEPILYSDQQLHGIYFTPTDSVKQAVLLAPPFFEEKRCAHRALTCCARALARAGVAVLHPDLYGTGNSRGNLADIGLDRWLDDLHAAFDTLRELAGDLPVTVLACRAGVLPAAQLIAEGLPVQRLILWQPVVAGRGYLHQLRTRRMIQDQMTGETPPETDPHEIEGHLLSPALFEGIQALRLPAEMPSISLRLLQCSFNDKLLGEYARVIEQWGTDRVQARRVICEPFWHPHSPGEYTDLAQAVVEEVLA